MSQTPSTALSAEKSVLSLEQVVAHLPTPVLPVSDAALDDYLNQLYQLGRARHTPNISPANTDYLQKLLRQHRPARILEIGCANGYSSLRLWQVARAWQARMVTMDISRPSYLEAASHFAAVGASIELHFGNALALLPSIHDDTPEGFDFIFIDAQKAHTLDFFIRARKLAAPNALIVIDDVLKFKDKMANFYDYLAQMQINYQITELADDEDGVMLIAV